MPLAKAYRSLTNTLDTDFLVVAGGSDGVYTHGTGDQGNPGGYGGQVVLRLNQALLTGAFPVVVGGVGANSSFNGVTAAAGFLPGGLGGSPNGHNGSNGISTAVSGTPQMYGSSGGGGGTDAAGSGGVPTGGGAGGIGAGSGGGDPADTTGPQVGGNAYYYGCGGGGGAAGAGSSGTGFQGIVIIRYPGGTPRGTGGTITTVGGYTVHTFTVSGTFTRI